MLINVKDIPGRVTEFEVEENETVLDLKAKVKDKLKVAKDQQKLLIDGNVLPDEKSFKELNIEEGATINFVILSFTSVRTGT
mmetsp:Transcript_110555/g.174173  ORF Transcript_110555/g.174173 Transcript_110555/m.174173 type:complete len:82 (-) Transcript_110555:52-297(-)|eukprot:CAMPEP_0169119224 /NCGR_PEP_ID=MMETSP1015-20121227/31433_1 /TAXON_ID=342587 /ORGANISM="Karlodinium micrum, Strain CCMP2283" /LENGTH=81 /DNA_ID=CAMNT_0009182071 /DNA_START=61 /DNA_END=306 /DNA_ORIENTATION=-